MAHNNDTAIKFAMGVLEQMPKADKEQLEDHMTAVLLVFWSALWGTFGTEYAKGFIEAQLRGMEGQADKYVKAAPH